MNQCRPTMRPDKHNDGQLGFRLSYTHLLDLNDLAQFGGIIAKPIRCPLKLQQATLLTLVYLVYRKETTEANQFCWTSGGCWKPALVQGDKSVRLLMVVGRHPSSLYRLQFEALL